MKGILRYLFQPSKNDREAIKSAYYESVAPTRVTMYLALAAAITFLVLTFVYPSYFGGTTVLYHQICYVWVILVAAIWLLGIRNAMKDYQARYRTVFVLNHFMGVSLYLWVVSLMIVNSMARGTVDTTLFMTVAEMYLSTSFLPIFSPAMSFLRFNPTMIPPSATIFFRMP